jgi:hypothetical protein
MSEITIGILIALLPVGLCIIAEMIWPTRRRAAPPSKDMSES